MQIAELEELHTGILRLTLAVPESREYWRSAVPGLKGAAQVERAFNERWFGARSMARVKLLLGAFALRFDRFPDSLSALRTFSPEAPQTRALICHWHVQLSDPLYRRFTGEFLAERRERGASAPDAPTVTRWVESQPNAAWAPATARKFATKLLRTAAEASLLPGDKFSPLRPPIVPDESLLYLTRLLSTVRFQGTLLENPYFRSVGLDADDAAERLRRLPGIHFRRMGDLIEFELTGEGSGA